VGVPQKGVKAERLSADPNSSGPEFSRLPVRTAGPGQAFLVAQTAWRATARQAAGAASSEIARVLPDQGLTIVHERLFGSLPVKLG
jgi:hypothetical protein